jgi:hypothetical protein
MRWVRQGEIPLREEDVPILLHEIEAEERKK